MLIWENTNNLMWLLPLGGVSLLMGFWMLFVNRRLMEVFGEKTYKILFSSMSFPKALFKLSLEVLVLGLIILGLARLQSASEVQAVKAKGMEIVLAVDVSRSMAATDIKPDRLSAVKKAIRSLIQKPIGRVGLVAFAGSAETITPLNFDPSSLSTFVESLSPGGISVQGTEFRKALLLSSELLSRGGDISHGENLVTKAIVLVSDGEDHGGSTLELAKELKAKGVYVFTVGVGTEVGAAVSTEEGRKGYLRDSSGNVVISRAHFEDLRQIAQAGGGGFYSTDYTSDPLEELYKDLEKLQTVGSISVQSQGYKEWYQWFLALAIFLACFEMSFKIRQREEL